MAENTEQLLPIGQRRVGRVLRDLRPQEIPHVQLALALQASVAQSAGPAQTHGDPGGGRGDLIDQPALPAKASVGQGPGDLPGGLVGRHFHGLTVAPLPGRTEIV